MTQTERDYSHRSLFEKLGVRSDMHVAVCGVPEDRFLLELDARLASAASQHLRTTYDMIFVQVDGPKDLERIPRSAKHLRPNGALWVFHPKGRGASPSDGEVRAAGIAAGLVDNKICALNDTHTAIRFVIPVAKRPATNRAS
jgi:predicted O-methyltransferase YrrM